MIDDDIFEPGPPLSEEEQIAQDHQARQALSKLMTYGFALTFLITCICYGLSLLGVPRAEPFAYGFLTGGTVCVLNMNALGRATWALFRGEKLTPILGFGASLALLAGAAFFIASTKSHWVMGFAIGLTMPVPIGLWFARTLTQQND